MAYFDDLSVCDYLPSGEGFGFVAVGWLEPGNGYLKDDVSKDFFEKLCSLLQKPWQPPVGCAGLHRCSFCRFSGGGEVSFGGLKFSSSSNNLLFVPSGNQLFVAPTGIAHYIDAHEYCPPKEFQQAVLNCPAMRSAEYLEALMATRAREWLHRLEKVAA